MLLAACSCCLESEQYAFIAISNSRQCYTWSRSSVRSGVYVCVGCENGSASVERVQQSMPISSQAQTRHTRMRTVVLSGFALRLANSCGTLPARCRAFAPALQAAWPADVQSGRISEMVGDRRPCICQYMLTSLRGYINMCCMVKQTLPRKRTVLATEIRPLSGALTSQRPNTR